MKDLKTVINVVISLAVAVFTATANGVGIDLSGFEGATFIYDVGIFGGTSPTATLRFTESDTLGGTYTLIAAGDLIGIQPIQITAAADELIGRVGYRGSKDFIRAEISAIAGTGPSLPLSCHVILSRPRRAPVA